MGYMTDGITFNLGAAVRRKFNKTTEKYGMRTYLGESDWHLKPAPPR
jgi:hypothetical protein